MILRKKPSEVFQICQRILQIFRASPQKFPRNRRRWSPFYHFYSSLSAMFLGLGGEYLVQSFEQV